MQYNIFQIIENSQYTGDRYMNFKYFAFTLAETLITLGIIGVVAGLTMPTLISNYRKHVVETRLEKFYSEINQAVKMSEIENGDVAQWENLRNTYEDSQHPTYEENLAYLQKYFIPYIKTINIEECVSNKLSVCVTLSNGSLFRFDSDMFRFYPNAKLEKDPTQEYLGKNCFSFIFAPNDIHYRAANNKGVEPYVGSWGGDYNELFTHPIYGCTSEGSDWNHNRYCTKIIQMNGWKIPKEYPIKF